MAMPMVPLSPARRSRCRRRKPRGSGPERCRRLLRSTFALTSPSRFVARPAGALPGPVCSFACADIRTPARVGSRPGSSAAPGGAGGPWCRRRSARSSVPTMSARSPRCSAVSAVDSTVWCGPPAVSQDSVEVVQVGRGFQTARATGSFGSGSARRDDVDLVGDQPEPVAEVGHARATTAGARGGVEDQPDRVLAAADAERVDLAASGVPAAIDGQTSSMCAPRISSSPGTRW